MQKNSVIRLKSILDGSGDLDSRFKAVRSRIFPIVPSQYDVTNLCNMTCTGCMYFEGDGWFKGDVNQSFDQWLDFFQSESTRGVNFPHIGGAEPSLNLPALRAAAKVFKRGVIYTNGGKKIPEEINLAIQVSIWSDDETEEEVRGNRFFNTALKHYSGDSRAIFVCTLSKASAPSIEAIVGKCAEHGVQITFNHFSRPNHREYAADYLRDWQLENNADSIDLSMSKSETAEVHAKIEALKTLYPETIVFSAHYAQQLASEDLYTLDSQGIATNCASRLDDTMRHYLPDMSREMGTKCCTPNVDCSSCSLYAMAYASITDRLEDFVSSETRLTEWLDIVETWESIFCRKTPISEAVIIPARELTAQEPSLIF